MHPQLTAELLTEQLASLDASFLERYRAAIHPLETQGDFVVVTTLPSGQVSRLRFDARNFDLDPPRVYFCDENGQPLPPGLCPTPSRGFLHQHSNPDITYPFFCVRGTYEYYVHSSHYTESWDALRNRTSLLDVVERILKRVHGG